MKKKLLLSLCCLLAPVMVLADDPATASTTSAAPTMQQRQTFSYAVGRDIGKSLEPVKDLMNPEALKQGLDDAASGKTAPYSDEEIQAAKAQVGQYLRAKAQAERDTLAASNLADAEKFLKKNGKRKGVTTTASGLQYEVLKSAKGERPKAGSTVTVHYRGTLLDGTEFDSSYARGVPVTFPLGGVIPGWAEGVQLMAPGAKYKFYLPPSLGYGERGAGKEIGPNAALIFEVELISFDDKPAE